MDGYDIPLPLSSMGDGFISLLKLTFISSLIEKGVVILEEPEISLHPGFISFLVEGILNNSTNTQFFISTHSKDFLQSILDAADWNHKSDDVLILRMHKRLDLINPEIELMSGTDAKDAINDIGLDLRGV